jgi:hypothetical protein
LREPSAAIRTAASRLPNRSPTPFIHRCELSAAMPVAARVNFEITPISYPKSALLLKAKRTESENEDSSAPRWMGAPGFPLKRPETDRMPVISNRAGDLVRSNLAAVPKSAHLYQNRNGHASLNWI